MKYVHIYHIMPCPAALCIQWTPQGSSLPLSLCHSHGAMTCIPVHVVAMWQGSIIFLLFINHSHLCCKNRYGHQMHCMVDGLTGSRMGDCNVLQFKTNSSFQKKQKRCGLKLVWLLVAIWVSAKTISLRGYSSQHFDLCLFKIES